MRIKGRLDRFLGPNTIISPDVKLCFEGLTVTYKGEYVGTVVSEEDGMVEIELDGPTEIPELYTPRHLAFVTKE